MGVLVSPASYVTPQEYIAEYGTKSSVTTAQVSSLLVGASARANAIMKRSLLATEVVEYFRGDGSAVVDLGRRPIAYVSQIGFAQPGLLGYPISRQNVLIDYLKGIMRLYQPISLEGLGFVARWPSNIEISIRYAYGYGYTVTPPTWTFVDGVGNNTLTIAPGSYDVAITAATPWGETSATPQTITTVSGYVQLTIQQTLGAERYRIYMRPSQIDGCVNPRKLILVNEVPATTFSGATLSAALTSVSPLDSNIIVALPTEDTSMYDTPEEIKQACIYLALDTIAQRSNPANKGILADVDLKFGQIGQYSKGQSPYYSMAIDLLRPFKLNSMFSA